MKLKTRFTPTPSGLLHWGNLFNFCLIWRYARLQKGTIQLRIDDLDVARTQEDSLIDIFETLHWLGFDWDEGPRDLSDFRKNYSQQLRMDFYFDELKRISTYVCECSRQHLKNRGAENYDGFCRRLQHTFMPMRNQIRFHSSTPQHDVVVWRRENGAAYHWVSVLEDERAGINYIVRGEDLRVSSVIQKELSEEAGLIHFPKAEIIHHKLLTNDESKKLSKSDLAQSVHDWRVKGKSKEEVFRELSRRAHWPFVIEKLTDLLENHTIDPST